MNEGFDLVGAGQLADTMNGANLVPLTEDFLSDDNLLVATLVVDATGDMEVTANGTGVEVGALSFLPGQDTPEVAEVGGTESNAAFNM